MRNCSIIQLEGIHEIVTPGIIYCLNKIGFKPTLFFNSECRLRRGDFFKYCNKLSFNLVEFDLKGQAAWDNLLIDIKNDNPEFIIINTLQNNERLKWYENIEKPIIGIVHNINMFLQTDYALEFIKRKNNAFFSIAQHVSFFLRAKVGFDANNIDYYIPAHLIDNINNTKKFDTRQPIKLVVMGGINNIRNRGFSDLLDILKERKESNPKVKFVIAGGGKDREKLENFVNKYEVQKYFDFVKIDETTKYVIYDEYYKSILDSDFLITLFAKQDLKYFRFKATASIMTAISLELPILTDNIARCIYDVPCLKYDNNNLNSIFETLEKLSLEEYNALKQQTIKYKELALARGVKSFEIAIENILS